MTIAPRGIEVYCLRFSIASSLSVTGLVTRIRPDGGATPKTAAAAVVNGDISVIVKTIWGGGDNDRERLMQKVGFVKIFSIDDA